MWPSVLGTTNRQSVDLPDVLYDRLDDIAKRDGTSIPHTIREILSYVLFELTDEDSYGRLGGLLEHIMKLEIYFSAEKRMLDLIMPLSNSICAIAEFAVLGDKDHDPLAGDSHNRAVAEMALHAGESLCGDFFGSRKRDH